MSDNKEQEVIVSIDAWVDRAKADPEAYVERQATEIFLTTLGITEPYCGKFFLKGGLLMGIVYDSPRHTADIDYTTNLEPKPEIVNHLMETLNSAFPSITAKLGYPDIVCKVQTIKLMPKEEGFADAKAPGFKITIAYAKRETNQEIALNNGRGVNVLSADVSFKEPIGGIQIVRLGEHGATIQAYSLMDIIAEKYRAFLQQEKRNRVRRQDIYDLSLLLERFSFDNKEKLEILNLLIEKCHARDINPQKESINSEELIRRAKSEWETMEIETGKLPPFDACYEVARAFYDGLPWDSIVS